MSEIFHSVQHVRDAGICLVSDWNSEMEQSEYYCEAGRNIYHTGRHLSWCTSGLRSEPAARATHGFHRGYVLQGQPLSARRKPEAVTHGPAPTPTPTPSGALLDASLTVSTWPTFSHESCFFPPSCQFGPVAACWATCCNVVYFASELIMQLQSWAWSHVFF